LSIQDNVEHASRVRRVHVHPNMSLEVQLTRYTLLKVLLRKSLGPSTWP